MEKHKTIQCVVYRKRGKGLYIVKVQKHACKEFMTSSRKRLALGKKRRHYGREVNFNVSVTVYFFRLKRILGKCGPMLTAVK